MKTATKKATKSTRQIALRIANKTERKAKKADVHALPQPDAKPVSGSVVPARFKAKANKAGVMRQDDLDTAVRNAFLAAGSNDLEPAQSARIACDTILQDNGLDVGRWAGKNPGMLSMNLRNVLRAIRRNGESVIVSGKVLKAVSA